MSFKRFFGFIVLSSGVVLILTFSMFFLVVGMVLVVFGYSLTGLNVMNLFKSLRDKSIGEAAFEEVERSAKRAEEIRDLLEKEGK